MKLLKIILTIITLSASVSHASGKVYTETEIMRYYTESTSVFEANVMSVKVSYTEHGKVIEKPFEGKRPNVDERRLLKKRDPFMQIHRTVKLKISEVLKGSEKKGQMVSVTWSDHLFSICPSKLNRTLDKKAAIWCSLPKSSDGYILIPSKYKGALKNTK